MINDNDNILYKEGDYYEKWNKWVEEIKGFPKSIKLISTDYTNYGYIKDFYYIGANNVQVYASLFFNNTIKAREPLVVLYHGLGAVIDSEGFQHIANAWVNAGYSVLGMDSRLQGGKTIDNESYEFQEYGLMALNILDEDKYYSKYLFQDALKLIDVVNDLAEVRNRPIVVTGGSKGGELSLMAAAKSKRVSLCICDIPSGCFLKGRVKGAYGNYASVKNLINDRSEIEDKVYKTLSYFDIIHLADEIKVPVLASVGSLDKVCPPKFFDYAFDRIDSPKEYVEYKDYGHGGYDNIHMPKKIEFIKKYFNKEI